MRIVRFRTIEFKVGGEHPVSWRQLHQDADTLEAWLETVDQFELEKM